VSTVFDYPCPGCGRRMAVHHDGHVECAACDQRYQARMGYLLPLPRPRHESSSTSPAASGLPAGTKA
jgi:hypothetical protein